MRSSSRFTLSLGLVFGGLAFASGSSWAAPPKAAPSAPSRTASKTAPKSTSAKSNATPSTRGRTDAVTRKQIAGGPTLDDAAQGADSPELRALHAAEREIFAPASPQLNNGWPSELPFPVSADDRHPRVHSSGLPPAPPASSPTSVDGVKDTAWLAKLDMPDLPVRWDARVVRYLEFFKDDPRGHSLYATWLRRSGRYREAVRKVFRRKGMPEDLVWLAMIESGFDAQARSPVGALGLWQFMAETGKIYGLSQDRWADQRMSVPVATEAAADFLADLHRRFGSWDLAMAGYNMGYGGVLSAVRRFNTNDYWSLCRLEGSIPWETTLYVPKILAAAIVSRNLAAFGFQDVVVEAALDGEEVQVAPSTSLATVAQACGVTAKEVEQLNPELRASRTPPSQEDWAVKVPVGKASTCAQTLAKSKRAEPYERYVVRFGETLEQIAQARRVSVAKLVELNAIAPGEVVRGGTTLLVPKSDGTGPADAKKGEKPVVVVPPDIFMYPDRRRVFYRVQLGDTIREVCNVFGVAPDEVRRWNGIDPAARLVDGMTLQIFAPRTVDLSHAMVLGEGDVRTIVAGTDEFFQHWDEKGRKRLVVTAKSGDTLESIGKKHGISTALMERINRRSRNDLLTEGESIVVWSTPAQAPSNPAHPMFASRAGIAVRAPINEPLVLPPGILPPMPDLLPKLP